MHTQIPAYTLNDGVQIPAVGLGTYKLNGAAGATAMAAGIGAGYRLIDSAFNYENEGAVGEAVRQSGLSRAQLFITSKLPGRHHRYEEAVRTIQESLYRARLAYYDLYLIHWPNPQTGLYIQAWQALIDARKWGLVRSIGVCNFLPQHLEKLKAETGVVPSVNQIELHPVFNQQEQIAYHQQQGIRTQSWSPLGRNMAPLAANSTISAIAKNHGKTPAQVVLRWHVQLGSIPIPKSAAAGRQAENLAIFDFALSDGEMESMAALSRPDGRIANQNPATYEEF